MYLSTYYKIYFLSLSQRLTRLHIFQAPRSLLPLKHAKFLQSALSLFGGSSPCKLSNIAAFIALTIYFVTARFILIWDPKNAFVIGFGESLTSHFLFILGFRLKLSAPNFLQNYHRYIKIITLIYNYLPRTYRGIRARAFNI